LIHEAHGDACRLGYLRVISVLSHDSESTSFDYLASLLLEVSRRVRKPEGGGHLTGLINGQVNARNYVTLASETGVLDRKTQTLGKFGHTYNALSSAAPYHEAVTGKADLDCETLVGLKPVEKVFFLHALLLHDYPFLSEMILWAISKGHFTRGEAMEHVMEAIYPEALLRSLPLVEPRRRPMIMKEAEEARELRQRRLSFSSKADWIRGRQYAKYRHMVPPRLEWLVDLGILLREGRGKFSVASRLVEASRTLEGSLRQPFKRVEEEFFASFVPLMVEARPAAKEEVEQELVDAYNRYVTERNGRLQLDVLDLVTCYSLMEKGKLASPTVVHRAFNNIAIRYPDKVFVAPGPRGTVEIARIELSAAEL